MLQINNLNMSAGDFSVNNISLAVPDGCCHVLLGGTGNGKTLILESIAGLRPIKSGEILADERRITKEFPENRNISYMPQDLALFQHLNVEKNIFYPKRFKKDHGRSDEEIHEIIKCLQIENIMPRSIRNLSGGEQQRVALARALASGNRILLLDEPFSALHFTIKRSLWGMLSDIQMRYNLSILMVTHDLEEAGFLADYISILHQGRILQTGTKENVFNDPAHLEVTKITGHYNYFSGEVISTENNHCIVNLQTLGTVLLINKMSLKSGDKAVIAIRTNKVKIIPPDSCLPNTFLCRIQNIYETSHYDQIVVAPESNLASNHASNNEEIVIDFYDKKNQTFARGQNVAVHLPPDEIDIFKDDISPQTAAVKAAEWMPNNTSCQERHNIWRKGAH